jgi:ATP synthase protein I
VTASLLGPVRTHRRRRERRSDGSFLRSVALVGAIGWLIVVPTVAGAFVGRFLDRKLQSGILFSAALIGLGAALGSWAAWRRVRP